MASSKLNNSLGRLVFIKEKCPPIFALSLENIEKDLREVSEILEIMEVEEFRDSFRNEIPLKVQIKEGSVEPK